MAVRQQQFYRLPCLEYQEAEDGKEYECRHYDASNLVYESEEAREAYDGNSSPYGRYTSCIEIAET